MKDIREWFPHAEVTDQPTPPAGFVAIPLQAQQWLQLKEEELTAVSYTHLDVYKRQVFKSV